MFDFVLGSDAIALPKGAWARTHRTRLRQRSATILGLTEGAYRPYAYPLRTPAGLNVAARWNGLIPAAGGPTWRRVL